MKISNPQRFSLAPAFFQFILFASQGRPKDWNWVAATFHIPET